MKSRIKRIIASVVLALGLSAPALVPAMVSAQTPDVNSNLCKGASLTFSGEGECDEESAGSEIDKIITTIINIVSLIVGVVSVLMIIVGGLKYITSSGESGNVTGAKNTILYAIVGLVVVALAQIIVRFVVARISKQ